MFTHMRIARPVTNLERSFLMYSQGLGLHKIAEFNDHHGFNGVMLGREDLDWHIEFTFCHHHSVHPLHTEEDLLVLYYPDKDEWIHACERVKNAGFRMAKSFNPYWDVNGRTFVDSDRYRVVLQNKGWA
ncbi:VOC family protein [Erwinia persicina]|uniref:Prolyl endopeptidase n=1 Tax=Erwinia persicina TaxID=55211 RepID=A0A4U3FM25_9GAMM|nr:VOC family protein [Erwinia persicina]MBC3945871.1 VOC family protein [Erwinia persicina]MBD8105451.1 VOC family protein [Erwinia persicina]MBD8208597.1 VOC family protein [Erwinia persicina]MCQ4092688.1 VOC family protein [Erwinia persicina]MCQ4100706.1 VOC family protein [Erwinia persicina]